MDLVRPAGQDLYLTQLPSYEYRDLVMDSEDDCYDFVRARILGHLARFLFSLSTSLTPFLALYILVIPGVESSNDFYRFANPLLKVPWMDRTIEELEKN